MNKRDGREKVFIPLFSALAFGLYPAATQLAYKHGGNASFVIIVTTFARAFALLLFCLIRKKRCIPERDSWRTVICGGFFQAISAVSLLGSLLFLPGPVTMTIFFTHTILLLFYLVLRREMKLTVSTALTTIVALIGVSLVVDVWHNTNSVQWQGVGLAMIASIATMSRLYVYGKQLHMSDPAVVGAQAFSVAALLTTCIAFISTPTSPTSLGGLLGVALSCLSLIFGTFTMFYGIAAAGSFRYSLTIKIEPAFTAMFSWLVMDQTLVSTQYMGILLVIASLIVYQLVEVGSR